MAASSAIASGPSVDLPFVSSYQLSSVAKATDNASGEFSPGPGKIDLIRVDHEVYVQVSTSARNGSRLLSLDDYESGIVFRNNTIILPVYSAGEKTGDLIVATDNLTANSYGYSGMVTGLELESRKITTIRNGENFSVSAIISLSDLPERATYRVTFADNASMTAAVSADLEASGLSSVATSQSVEVSAISPTTGNVVGFVIITIETGESLPGQYDDSNVTFYRFDNDELSRLRFSSVKSPEGILTYQAMAPGTGLFMVADTVPRGPAAEGPTSNNSDLVILGGTLAVLVIALAAMVRRVRKR